MILVAQNLCGRHSLCCWYLSCTGEQREWAGKSGVADEVDGDAGGASEEWWGVAWFNGKQYVLRKKDIGSVLLS